MSIKARRNENEVGLEVDETRQNLIAPRAAPIERILV
jgi:hypothetical protein